LIRAGLELFGEHGPAATTTRMLAARAGANVASIPYYFGSKEGLYLAVVEHIVERMRSRLGETIRDLEKRGGGDGLSPDEARDNLVSMIRALAGLFVESDEPRAWAQIIVREQARPTAAFDVLYEGHIRRMQSCIGTLVAAAAGLDAGSQAVKLRTHALIGQVLGFLVAREALLRSLGVRKLRATHVTAIHAVLEDHVHACLNAAADTGKAT
jgi:AcrR family transcriptional regulator